MPGTWKPFLTLQLAIRVGSYKKFKEIYQSGRWKRSAIFLRDFLDSRLVLTFLIDKGSRTGRRHHDCFATGGHELRVYQQRGWRQWLLP